MISKILENINNSKSIAIFSHINADPDALGSSIALKLMLEKLNKTVCIFIDEPIHKNFEFLDTKKHINNEICTDFDLAISLDCPNVKRFGTNINRFYKFKNSINIDHHPDNEKFAKINYIDSKSSSTSVILFNLFKSFAWEIDSEIATCLFTGIAGDTGGFKHNNTSGKDFLIASDLYDKKADLEIVNYNLFSRMSIAEFNLLKFALNKIEFFNNGRIALLILTIQDFINSNTSIEDTHFLIGYLMNIEGVKIASVMSQEKKEEFKVSVRSREKYSAQNVAKSFGGGGHILASGCRLFCNYKKAKENLLKALVNEDKRCTEL